MKNRLNSFQLKCICVVMMSVGMLLQIVDLKFFVTPGNAREVLTSEILRFLGRAFYLASFPLSAFLLVEAERKTSDRKKLLLRLVVAALAAEVVMDACMFGFSDFKLWAFGQNYFFTLLIGFCALWGSEFITKKFGQGTLQTNLGNLLVYLTASTAAVMLRTEQGSVGVLTIIALSLFYGNKMFSLIVVAALYIFFVGGKGDLTGLEYIPALSILIVWMYNGERGKANRVTRIVFYAVCPVVYCLLALWA